MRMDAEPKEVMVETVETESERLDRLGIYGEIKRELIKRGIPAEEIAFIHDFATSAKKAQAFADANAGKIRVMLASTEKAGTGVNMQERLYALHHLDAPWRPSDVEQREGRILRQGNRFAEVQIFNYVTENSFDGYMWQTLENKARFISQIMTGEVTARTAEDIDDLVITAAQIKAIASGNPRILERVSLEVELARLGRLYSVWRNSRRHLKWEAEALTPRLQEADQRVTAHEQALAVLQAQSAASEERFTIHLRASLDETKLLTLTERAKAYEQLDELRRAVKASASVELQHLGNYRGFEILGQRQRNRDEAIFTPVEGYFRVPDTVALYPFKLSESAQGALQSIDAQLRALDTHLQRARKAQSELRHKERQLAAELGKGWEYAPKYLALQTELARVNQSLKDDGSEIGEPPQFVALEEDALRNCVSPQPAPSELVITAAEVITIPEPQPEAIEPTVEPSPTTEKPIVIDLAQPFAPASLEELRNAMRSKRPARTSSAKPVPSAQMSLW